MKLSKRKLVTVISEAILEKLLVKDLRNHGAHGYTISDVRGEGSRGARRGEWDQNRNIKIEVICSEEIAHALFAYLIDTYYRDYAMVVFLKDVEVARESKF